MSQAMQAGYARWGDEANVTNMQAADSLAPVSGATQCDGGGTVQDLVDRFNAANTQLSRLKGVAEAEGFSCYEVRDDEGGELGGVGMGVGFVIPLGDESQRESVAVSVSSSRPQLAYLTAGVLRDVTQDRLAVLETCNRATWDHPGLPAFLHANDSGWDVLLQTTQPVEIFVARPDLLSALVGASPKFIVNARAALAERQVSGSPYQWSRVDTRRLVGRSLS
jgi:hypothetical protein